MSFRVREVSLRPADLGCVSVAANEESETWERPKAPAVNPAKDKFSKNRFYL